MIALDPNKTTWIQLPKHSGQEDAPAFEVKFATAREMDRFLDLLGLAQKSNDAREQQGLLSEALNSVIVGWRNVVGRDGRPIPFSADGLDGVASYKEKWSLACEYPAAVSVGEDDAKKSDLPSASAGAASVSDAPPADA